MEILLIHNFENSSNKTFLAFRLQSTFWIRNETTNAALFTYNFNIYRNGTRGVMAITQAWLQFAFRPIFNFKFKRLIRKLEIASFGGILVHQLKKWILRLLISMCWVFFLIEAGKTSLSSSTVQRNFHFPPEVFHYQIVATTLTLRKSLKIDMRVLLLGLRLSTWDSWNQRVFLSSFFFIMSPLTPFWEFFNSYFLTLNWS